MLASGTAAPALAQDAAPAADHALPITDDITFTPLVDARLRWESVGQDNALKHADAVTARVRLGGEVKAGPFAFLAESEATLGIDNDYNSSTNDKTRFAGVSDPQNIELNRLQLVFTGISKTILTVGRQRINIDDQRWVGASGWRQNEQTFDAVRLQSKLLGPVDVDIAYSNSQRTVYGIDAGPRTAFDGDYWLLGAGAKLGPVAVKAFSYLLDQGEASRFAFSSQTYGARATGAIPLGKARISFGGSYAHQSDWKTAPVSYDANYYAAELGATACGLGITGGYEELGSDHGRAAVQTPLATLHKFNGWADQFPTTPNDGLRDYYATLSYAFTGVKALPGLKANVTYHRFDSDHDVRPYGDEWDASVGSRFGPVAVLVKYADYSAKSFSVDTHKFWLEFDWSY